MIDLYQYVVCDPHILGGRPVFRGSRVPVETLFQNLADGLCLEEILDSYPSVSKAAAIALLEASNDVVIASMSKK